MRLKKSKIILALALIGILCYIWFEFNEKSISKPNWLSRSDLENVTTTIQKSKRAIKFYIDEIDRNPNRVESFIALAQLYLQAGRTSGFEMEYSEKAALAIKRALKLQSNNSSALATKAALLASKHRFEEAIPLAEKAIQQNPYSAYAYGVLVDSYIEMGNYEKAVSLCDAMMGIRPDLRSYSRASYLREIYSDMDGAIEAMKLASSAGIPGHSDRSWSLFYVGDLYLDRGDIKGAEAIFNHILFESPGNIHALGGLAEIRMKQGKFDEALSILLHAYELVPDHGILELLAEVYLATNNKRQANDTIQRILQQFKKYEDAGWDIDLEYASFCSQFDVNMDEALIRIKEEFQRRPDNIEVLETYAWILFKNGHAEKAVPLIEDAMRLNTKDTELFFRAGKIFESLGNFAKSKEYYAVVKKINTSY